MRKFSKKAFQIFGLASLAIALTVGFSCKKDKTGNNPDPNGGGGNSTLPLIARADLNFVTDGEIINFKCYMEENYGEISTYGDTLMYLRFRNIDKNGDDLDGPTFLISLENKNGFHQGDVYKATDDPNDKKMWLQLTKNHTEMISYGAGNKVGNPGLGELKITSMP